MKIEKSIRDFFLGLQKNKKLFLEGNLLKVIEADEGDDEFAKYLEDAIEKDKASRKRRLEITKQVQEQNAELLKKQEENQNLTDNLRDALSKAEESTAEAEKLAKEAELAREEAVKSEANAIRAKEEADLARKEAESAKNVALNDLDIIQKRSQTELIGTIVKVALLVIISVGVITTGLYAIAMWTGKDTQIIGSTWSNMFGILLTNAFSIVGTIMGVKYASEKNE